MREKKRIKWWEGNKRVSGQNKQNVLYTGMKESKHGFNP